MSYRSAVTGNYDSDTSNDVRCAVRFARAETQAYGGDPSRVVVVGHSQGGFVALEVAIQPDAEAEACLAEGSGKPDGVVALGSPSPSFAATRSIRLRRCWLFAGAEDGDAEGTAQRLIEAGATTPRLAGTPESDPRRDHRSGWRPPRSSTSSWKR